MQKYVSDTVCDCKNVIHTKSNLRFTSVDIADVLVRQGLDCQSSQQNMDDGKGGRA